MITFGLIGAAGYIAPRHMRAIRDTGNSLVWVVDPSDSVGILDSYFPNAEYYRGIGAQGHKGIGDIDFVSICSPNYLHAEHIRWALEQGAHVICEKPLVTDLRDLDEIEKMEQRFPGKVNTIMQLRLHPIASQLLKIVNQSRESGSIINLNYVTARGHWYHHSWKGEEHKSGGLVMNIGIHLFDLVSFVFGPMRKCHVTEYQPHRASGILELDRAEVHWMLSVNESDLPESVKKDGKKAWRSIGINGEEVEFTEGFTELHTRSYEEVLQGRGFGVKDVRESLRIVDEIRKLGRP